MKRYVRKFNEGKDKTEVFQLAWKLLPKAFKHIGRIVHLNLPDVLYIEEKNGIEVLTIRFSKEDQVQFNSKDNWKKIKNVLDAGASKNYGELGGGSKEAKDKFNSLKTRIT